MDGWVQPSVLPGPGQQQAAPTLRNLASSHLVTRMRPSHMHHPAHTHHPSGRCCLQERAHEALRIDRDGPKEVIREREQ